MISPQVILISKTSYNYYADKYPNKIDDKRCLFEDLPYYIYDEENDWLGLFNELKTKYAEILVIC